MNLLVTCDENYLAPLRVMLYSAFAQSPDTVFDVYLMHSSIPDEKTETLRRFVEKSGSRLHALRVPEDAFSDAPTLKHFTKEMYYRLLAFQLLPENMEKILYLDPDILIINPLDDLYQTDVSDWLFAAAHHDYGPIGDLNRVRLDAYEMPRYYNSGVLLMNLKRQREEIREEDIFNYIREKKDVLVLPDQDVLNALYSHRIHSLPDVICNYETRFHHMYGLSSKGEIDLDFVIKNTVVLHFCGKRKPWHPNYIGKFHALYRHYAHLADRYANRA